MHSHPLPIIEMSGSAGQSLSAAVFEGVLVNDAILLVEDDPAIAELTARALRGLGYRFAGRAATGEEAVQAAESVSPSLVLMDIGLPGRMDGIETAGRITRILNIPVIFLTAALDEQTLERAKLAGPSGYIVKPFEPKNLHAAIEIALSQHQAREKRLQEAQAKAEKRFRELAAAALFQAGNGGEILQANQALAGLLGYDSPQDLAATAKTVKQVLNLDITGTQSLVSGQSAPPVPGKHFELNAYRKDGSTIWVSGNLTIIRNRDGEVQLYEGKIGSVAI
jgi:PAS domain S-box-containing protein